MNKIKVKGYTRMVYNQKKNKLQPKKQLRIKHSTVAFVALITALSVVSLQFRSLMTEIGDISHSKSVVVEKAMSANFEPKEVIVSEILPNLPSVEPTIEATFAYINGNWSEDQLKIRVATELKIREIAEQENFKHADYLVKLSDCESLMGLKLINNQGNNPNVSVDEGYFMWNSHWQKDINERCAYDLDCETKEAIKKINAGGQGIWVCDKIVKGKTNFR